MVRESSATAGQPLTFHPVMLEKVWGGRRLESVLGRKLPGHDPIGEIWGIWDGLTIASGPHQGETLAALAQRQPEALIAGSTDPSAEAKFPLLIKFLDASQNLSIQVHPDDDWARSVEQVPFGKCEMWYVLHAEPGAVIYHGTRRAVTREELIAALGDGSILTLLQQLEVRSGDVIINPPGTIHALGAGIVLYELQQSCDITYRLYDWDRGDSAGPKRDLHLDKGSAVSDLDPPAQHRIRPIARGDAADDPTILCACRSFVAELLTLGSPRRERGAIGRFEILTALEGSLRLSAANAQWPPFSLRAGDSILLPSGSGAYTISPVGAPGRLIKSYVPDLARDIAQPLLARGIAPDVIIQLGGDPRRSDLQAVVAGLSS